ncbi:TetR/AcrR family transcriptional regulator [Nocardiopsis sp. NPDC050513]|uniref:TetR/AcrR family transcriptional regulator n=1 Tax=Nocardiopsis sp. NPDC050513 TaxID=3364338 RepID=UPI0037ADAF4B
MTDSPHPRATDKRRRLAAAAARVLHEQGVERTTIADIAHAADIPVGNVYYYFKTKDDLVRAALTEHTTHLAELTRRLDQLPDPRQRLKALVDAWVAQRHTTARHGCPTGTLAVELDKRQDTTLDQDVAHTLRQLLDWAEHQFRTLGLADPHDLALTLLSHYQGMSLLTNALRDPDITTRQGARLTHWIDTLAPADQTP